MEKEARGRGASAGIGDGEEPSANDGLRHFEGLGVGDQKEDQRRIKGVFSLEGQIRLLGGRGGGLLLAVRHSPNPGLRFSRGRGGCAACLPSLKFCAAAGGGCGGPRL